MTSLIMITIITSPLHHHMKISTLHHHAYHLPQKCQGCQHRCETSAMYCSLWLGGPRPCARDHGRYRHVSPSLPSPAHPGNWCGPGREGEGTGQGGRGEGEGRRRGGEGNDKCMMAFKSLVRLGQLTVMPHQPQRKPERQSEVEQFLAHTWQRAPDGRLPSIQWCRLTA